MTPFATGQRLRLPSGAIGEIVSVDEREVELHYLTAAGSVHKHAGNVTFSPRWLDKWRLSQLRTLGVNWSGR